MDWSQCRRDPLQIVCAAAVDDIHILRNPWRTMRRGRDSSDEDRIYASGKKQLDDAVKMRQRAEPLPSRPELAVLQS